MQMMGGSNSDLNRDRVPCSHYTTPSMSAMSGSNRLYPWLEAKRTTRYAYRAFVFPLMDSNHRPSHCKCAALTP